LVQNLGVESLAFGTAKRADLATQPRDSLNVVVYEMSDDREELSGTKGLVKVEYYTRVYSMVETNSCTLS
jgi:hypothetical protein